MTQALLLYAAALSALLATTVGAAETLENGSHACATEADEARRLACYDAAFPPVYDEQTRAAARAADAERARVEFGLNSRQVLDRRSGGQFNAGPSRIEAQVVAIEKLAKGTRLVTLDNDQVWLLTEAESIKNRLSTGDDVVVKRAALDSHLMVTPGRASLRTRRVK